MYRKSRDNETYHLDLSELLGIVREALRVGGFGYIKSFDEVWSLEDSSLWLAARLISCYAYSSSGD